MERYFDCTCDCTDCAVVDCEFVKNAVVKQIAQKPIVRGLGQRYCPSCGFGGANDMYCSKCGQKLSN